MSFPNIWTVPEYLLPIFMLWFCVAR